MEKIVRSQYNVLTGEYEEFEEYMEFPNPRINEINQRLGEIRIALAEGDWKTIKFMEIGVESPEYIEHKLSRQNLRLEYNAIEEELKSLEG